jgi:Protein of unknown function (DUF3180)
VTPIRPWPLMLAAVLAGAAGWLVIRFGYASFPPLPWTAAAALALLAIAEVWSGRNVRAQIRGRVSRRPLAPIAIARMALVAKASAMAAAIFGGVCAGFLGYLGGMVDKTAPRRDTITAAVTLVTALALAAAALYLERSCRTPGDPGPDPG